MERIGIYGGAFNPPHIGHVRAAQYALEALCLSKLLVIPTCVSPHKQAPDGSADPRHRLEMLRLCFAETPTIEVSDLELQRGGSSYTYETVAQVRALYPEAELVLFMGTDMFLSFHNWRYPEKILAHTSLAVFYRGQKDEQDLIRQQTQKLEEAGAKIYLVENPLNVISSTDLRRMLVFHCADAFLEKSVLRYIHENNLYSTDRCLEKMPVEQLQDTVVSLLKPDRVAHVLGCREAAVELARIWGADETDAARAALLHDITKALDGPLQLTLCDAYGIILDNFSVENPKTLHALTGSLVAERIFGENTAVVDAIRSHTTGKANMNTLEKIIYVADYMEPNRNFPGVDKLRELAHTDLDQALKLGLEMTLDMLRSQGKEISKGSLEALAWLER